MGFQNAELVVSQTLEVQDVPSGVLWAGSCGCGRVSQVSCTDCAQDERHLGWRALQAIPNSEVRPNPMVDAAADWDAHKQEDADYVRCIARLNILMRMLVDAGIPFASDYPATDTGNVSREIGGWGFDGSATVTFDADHDPALIAEFGIGTPCLFYLTNSALSDRGGWIAYPTTINRNENGTGTITFAFVSAGGFTRAMEKLDPNEPILAMCRLWAVGFSPIVPAIVDLALGPPINGTPSFPVWPADGPGAVIDPLSVLPELLTSYPFGYNQDIAEGAQRLRRIGMPSLWSLAGVNLLAAGRMYPTHDFMSFGSGGWGTIRTWTDSNGIERAELRSGIEVFEDSTDLGPGGIRRTTLLGHDDLSTDANDPERHYVSCLASGRMGRGQYTDALQGPFLDCLDFRSTALVVPRIANGTALQRWPV